jgi:ferredoxin
MIEYTEKIKEIAGRILKDGRVDVVIGFRKGTVPMMSEPCCIGKGDDAEKLWWDSNCGINLCNYLTDRKENIGIVAKGCDSRNIIVHIIENKIKRDQLYIIGVPCQGMIDRRKIANLFKEEILAVSENGSSILVKGKHSEKRFEKQDVLQQNCAKCIHRNPVLYDELVGDQIEEQTDVDRYEDVDKIETMPPENKWKYFDNLLSACIRCYACRNACPLCYCPTCFVDESRPQWVGKTNDPIDTRTFHFLRAFHCAGRCTDCGSCERACPVGINVRTFTKKLEKDCKELFDWEAGLTLDIRPPLDVYNINDPEDFIK